MVDGLGLIHRTGHLQTGEAERGASCRHKFLHLFVKQLGVRPYGKSPGGTYDSSVGPFRLTHKKGGNPQEWPEGLRVREFPSTVPDA